MPGLPSGRRVIALREVDEMARTRTLPHYWHRPARPTISETCRPGEGIALVRVAPAMVTLSGRLGQPCAARGPAGGRMPRAACWAARDIGPAAPQAPP
jgi:hypothetical protein